MISKAMYNFQALSVERDSAQVVGRLLSIQEILGLKPRFSDFKFKILKSALLSILTISI